MEFSKRYQVYTVPVNTIRFLNRDQIMTFVTGLHDIQEQMIEEAVEKSDYKDAKLVLEHIMKKKVVFNLLWWYSVIMNIM